MDSRKTRMARKGRGALSNPSGRFEPLAREACDDGWGGLDDELPPLRTTVQTDSARTIITRNQSPDVPFDRSINPYRGCEHGCAYCFARPSYAYLGLSPGQDFETRLFAKPQAPALLQKELSQPGYQCRVIALGTNTDPYQPVERKQRIVRAILEILAEYNHPVGIVTKSALITRDVDILAPMAAKRLAKAYLSVTSLDRELSRRLEPRAPLPARRLETIRDLTAAGIPVGVLVAPIIPGLNDGEIEHILGTVAKFGATSAGYVLLRLPHEVKALFKQWLAAHAPTKAKRVMSLVRQTRGGKEYDSRFGSRMKGEGAYAQMIRRRFDVACRRLGLNERSWDLDTKLFCVPARIGEQLRLL